MASLVTLVSYREPSLYPHTILRTKGGEPKVVILTPGVIVSAPGLAAPPRAGAVY